jgi:hypothetical protein
MSYYKQVLGRDVWITVEKPLVYSEPHQAFVLSERFCCAYRIDQPPNMVVHGTYLHEADHLRWFMSEQDAVNAALDEVNHQLPQ